MGSPLPPFLYWYNSSRVSYLPAHPQGSWVRGSEYSSIKYTYLSTLGNG